jgi:cell division protein FtsL
MSLLTTAPPRRATARIDAAPGVDAPQRREQRPPLRLVPPPEPARRRRRVGLVGTVALGVVLLGIFALAVVHALVVQAQFELDRIDQQVADRRGELDALRLEVAQLESPQSIADAAADLGMVTPPDRVWLEPVGS